MPLKTKIAQRLRETFLFAGALCTAAYGSNTHRIGTASELIEWANSASFGSENETVMLTADIVFDGTLQEPLGWNGKTCTPFRGTFDGQNHTIMYFKVTLTETSAAYESGAGLFCELSGATAKNLVIDESCNFSSTNTFRSVGALAAEITVSLVMANVHNRARTTGVGHVGGLIGYVNNNTQSLSLIHCTNFGDVSASMFDEVVQAGGLIGMIWKNELVLDINHCTNYGAVYAESNDWAFAGGFIGYFIDEQQGKVGSITIANSSNAGKVNATHQNNSETMAGGLAGQFMVNALVSIQSFINSGAVSATADFNCATAGGLFGRVEVYETEFILSHVTNTGKVTAKCKNGSKVGGLIGYIILKSSTMNTTFCVNKGQATSPEWGFLTGGMIGTIELESSTLYMSNSTNHADVTTENHSGIFGSYTGGLIEMVSGREMYVVFATCENRGHIKAASQNREAFSGGLVGDIGYFTTLSVTYSYNTGTVTSTSKSSEANAGGLFGSLDVESMSKATITICRNSGDVTSTSLATSGFSGGLIGDTGMHSTSKTIITNCVNTGFIDSTPAISPISYAGGLIGDLGAQGQTTIENCVNQGTVKGQKAYGIARQLDTAANVVSMGKVNGSNEEHALWSDCNNDCGVNVFALDGICCNQDEHNATRFVAKVQTSRIVTFVLQNDNKTHVEWLLNDWVAQQRDGQYTKWNTTLGVGIDSLKVCVTVGPPVNNKTCTYTFETYPLLKDAIALAFSNSNASMSDFYLVDKRTKGLIGSDAMNKTVERNVAVLLCHQVVLTGAAQMQEFVEHGKTLDSNKNLSRTLHNDDFAFSTESGELVDGSTIVYNNTKVIVYKNRLLVRVTVVFGNGGGINVTQKTVLEAVAKLAVGDVKVLKVKLYPGSQGITKRVEMSVMDDQAAATLAGAIQEQLEKGSACAAGVLCQATDVEPKPTSSSSSGYIIALNTQCIVLFLFALLVAVKRATR